MENQVSPSMINKMRIIFFALIMGCLMFAGASLTVRGNQPVEDNQIFLIVGIVAAVAGAFGVYFFTQKKADSAAAWNVNHILGYALAEGTTMINLVFFFIGGKMVHIYVAAAILAAMISRYPRARLNQQDGQDLRSPGSFES